MALYQLLPIGVLKTDTMQRLIPQSGALWDAYIAWRKQGNQPDPYVAPPPPAETLPQAKRRRIVEIAKTGLERIQTRFPALRSMDEISLFRELWLSLAPAARQPTADMTWMIDTYQAGTTALDQVKAATSIAQVDAVAPSWPPL